MTRRILARIASLAVALGIVVPFTPSAARANMTMEITDGTNYKIVTDTNNTGGLSFVGGIGNFSMNVVGAASQPPNTLDPNAIAALDLSSMNVASSSGGKLTIILENTGFTGTAGLLGENGSIGGTIAGGTVTAMSWVSPSNAVPTLSGATAPSMSGAVSGLNYTASAGLSTPFSGSGSATFTNTGGTFALFQEIVINFSGSGSFSGDLSNEVAPEPSTMALAGLGALGFVVHALRRRKARGGD